MTAARALLLMLFGALIVAACNAAPAHADPVAPYVINYASIAAPAVCGTLDDHPSFPGISGVIQAIQDDSGFTTDQAVQVLVISVQTRCVRHLPLLQRFADTYAPAPKGQLA
ncbi:DUF732 domain-containing protein [Mycobacterium sp. TY814]|uniref:DUF732 domain-containing protein n=1 Tax=Mycobacterium sp. TY814 TaxID=3050580 RepID=UPI0027407B13|nr:DUF732 domain-containing protein [Mycobacterium sp. TY814]MDP7721836.1 DUF732 domain-containing protein [Mycobacterium sp. TY814]